MISLAWGRVCVIRMTVFLLRRYRPFHFCICLKIVKYFSIVLHSINRRERRRKIKKESRIFCDSWLQIAPIRNVRKMEEWLPFVSFLSENYKVLFYHFGSVPKPKIIPIRNVRKMEEWLPFVSFLPWNYKVLFYHFSKTCRKSRFQIVPIQKVKEWLLFVSFLRMFENCKILPYHFSILQIV